jgi:predicted alpha/beta-fold hydrolase
MTVKPLFTPPRYCRNPHIQSALNSIGPRKIRANRLAAKLNSEYLILTTEAGVRLAAEYDLSSGRVSPSKKALVILIHGWEGSSRSAYQVTTAKYLLDRGFDVLRLNMRDHGDTQHLNRGIFNSTMTAEVADAIGVFLQQHSYSSVFFGRVFTGWQLYPAHCCRSGHRPGPEICRSYFAPGRPGKCHGSIESGLVYL